jgi:signal transduction histidine kinase
MLGLAGLVLVAVSEVARRVAVERELRAQLAQVVAEGVERERLLQHSLRVDTLGQTAGLVVHQLRNHLQVIGGDAALGPGDALERKDQRFAEIQAEVQRATKLVEEVLALAHPIGEPAGRVDLVQLCRNFAERVRGLLPGSIALELALAEDAVPVEVDVLGVEHALLNLVLNARHAMRNGGVLRIEVRRQSGHGIVTIGDSGEGISPSLAERIFDPYFTTKPRGQGSGLGLAAVRRFAQASGGKVTLESKEGEGAAFSLWFPLRDAEPARPHLAS